MAVKSYQDNTESNYVSEAQVQYLIRDDKEDWKFVSRLKEVTGVQDELLASWLDITVKTFRTYKKEGAKVKAYIKERAILIAAVFAHGIEVFGGRENMLTWLNSKNFYLDNEKPVAFMNTVSGLRLLSDRLVSMEYGDNA